jgi:hypothetical protein
MKTSSSSQATTHRWTATDLARLPSSAAGLCAARSGSADQYASTNSNPFLAAHSAASTTPPVHRGLECKRHSRRRFPCLRPLQRWVLGNLELPGKVGTGALSAQEVGLAKSLRGTKDSNAIANQLFWAGIRS